MIDEIANPRPVCVGEHFTGTVVKTTTFGAFVNLVPGRDGLVHISKLGQGQAAANVEDAVKEGDTIEVEVQDIDDRGKISLKPVGEEWAIPEGMEVRRRRTGRPRRRPRPRPAAARPRPPARDRERRTAPIAGVAACRSDAPSSARACASSPSGCPASAR